MGWIARRAFGRSRRCPRSSKPSPDTRMAGVWPTGSAPTTASWAESARRICWRLRPSGGSRPRWMRCRRLRMAKRGAKEAQAELPADSSATATPAPPEKLHVTLTELPQGQVLHRVHQNQYRADQFNPGVRGNARFSPIQDGRGQPIPTLYGGTTVECALMETVFHDVPHTAGFKSFDKSKLAGQVHSTVEVRQSLQVVDLASVPLRKLGITRKQLIDSE